MDLDFSFPDALIQSHEQHGRTRLFFKRLVKIFLRLSISLWVLITLCFFLIHIIPGDPFQDEQGIPAEVLWTLKRNWGLDQPLSVQYFSYVKNLLHGDLGVSMRYPSESVGNIIARGFPISCLLGFQALCFALPLGILLGGLSAYYANKRFDVTTTLGATLGISVPSFVIAAFLQLLLGIFLPLFPVARSESFWHTILPSFALSVGPMCSIMRLMRANVLDILSREWIMTARMKGLSEGQVLLHHVVPNAFLPVIHYIGPTIANLLVGSFVVERVFGIPGLGQWFVNGVISRDYAVISGLTLFYGLILFFVHSFINFITIFFDPRMDQKKE